MSKILPFILFILSINIEAQELFRLDFENEQAPNDWTTSTQSEWGHAIGENGSNFFRFHPFSNTDILQSPTLNLEEGFYTFYFSWNETGTTNPDFVNVKIRQNNQNWEEVSDFGGLEGGASLREWKKDSVVFGNLDANYYTIQLEYKSIGKFPSQYIGLDNIYLIKSDQITGIASILENVGFMITPNPANNLLQYSIEDSENRNFILNIYNNNGQLVKSLLDINTGNHLLDVSELNKGNYLLELRHKDSLKMEQFVIQ